MICDTSAADKKTVENTDLNNRWRNAFLLRKKSPLRVRQSGNQIDKEKLSRNTISKTTKTIHIVNNTEMLFDPCRLINPSKTALKKEL